MNRTPIAILCALMSPLAHADAPAFFSNITNLWHQGQMSNVLAIADARLVCNSNDFVGLLLQVEFETNSEFDNALSVSNAILRMLAASQAIQTQRLLERRTEFAADLEDLLELLSDESMSAEIESDKAKAFLPGKRMLFEEDLLAACLDGLATNLPPAQQ